MLPELFVDTQRLGVHAVYLPEMAIDLEAEGRRLKAVMDEVRARRAGTGASAVWAKREPRRGRAQRWREGTAMAALDSAPWRAACCSQPTARARARPRASARQVDCVNIFISEGAGVRDVVKELETQGIEVPRDAFGHYKLDAVNVGKYFAEQFATRIGPAAHAPRARTPMASRRWPCLLYTSPSPRD